MAVVQLVKALPYSYWVRIFHCNPDHARDEFNGWGQEGFLKSFSERLATECWDRIPN
jgi:hypothetical protein